MFDTVNDLTLIVTENDIAVLSHNFNDQVFPAKVTKFVEMFNRKMNDTLKSRLPDINNAAALICLRRSIQKFGAVIGLGLFFEVR